MDILNQLHHEKETYAIIGAAIEVHKELGPGFLEQVYQEALELEFINQNIPYEREKNLKIYYKGVKLKKEYATDFFCFDKIVVELKALSEIKKAHQSQLLNYLTATRTEVGLILNFGTQSLQRKRMIK
jgi:GxxExxY protein